MIEIIKTLVVLLAAGICAGLCGFAIVFCLADQVESVDQCRTLNEMVNRK